MPMLRRSGLCLRSIIFIERAEGLSDFRDCGNRKFGRRPLRLMLDFSVVTIYSVCLVN